MIRDGVRWTQDFNIDRATLSSAPEESPLTNQTWPYASKLFRSNAFKQR